MFQDDDGDPLLRSFSQLKDVLSNIAGKCDKGDMWLKENIYNSLYRKKLLG